MANSEDTNAAVWKSDLGVNFWKSTAADRERRRAGHRTLLAELLPFGPDEEFTFVDLGAGTGAASRTIMDYYPRARAVLADFSPQMMAQGAAELTPYEGRYRYVEFDLAKPGPWPDGIPDPAQAVITSLAVHHLNDERKRQLFAEIFDRLAPGGWFLNYDPVTSPEPVVEEAWLRAADRRDPEAAHKRTHRTPEEQLRYENHVRYMIPLDSQVGFLRAAGFEGVDVYWKELEYVIYGGRRPPELPVADDGFDAVVVGSGPNGLTGAITLAAAGRRVLLVEGADEFGGGLRSFTLDGAVCDMCATALPYARASKAFRDMDLPVEWAEPEIEAAHPLDGQDAVLVHRDEALTAMTLGARRDAKAWHTTVGATARGGTPLFDTLLSPLSVPRAPLQAARFGALGVLPATVLANALFKGERAKAVFAGMAGHSMLDLSAPVTGGYGLLFAGVAHRVGWPLVRGGSQRLADAMIARFRQLGGTAETGHPVHDLGDIPRTPLTLLDVTPRQLQSIAGDRLPPGYRSRLQRFRYGPGVFKLDLVLSGPVPWADPEVSRAATVHLGGTLEEIAASEATVANNGHPERPFVLAVQPVVADPARAPRGKHVLWAYCHVPNGSNVDMTRRIEDQVERFAPGFRDLITARAAHGPAALEKHNPNLVGGDIGGGSAALTQFVSRPVLSKNPWVTPIPGVYLCSASTPPGPGVHGMGGYHAARRALRRS